MRTIPIHWHELESAFERNAPDMESFLDSRSGEVVTVNERAPDAQEVRSRVAAGGDAADAGAAVGAVFADAADRSAFAEEEVAADEAVAAEDDGGAAGGRAAVGRGCCVQARGDRKSKRVRVERSRRGGRMEMRRSGAKLAPPLTQCNAPRGGVHASLAAVWHDTC